VNLDGFFHITRPAIARMESQGAGHVVTITTTLVEHANASVPSVLASLTKGGLAAARSRWRSSTPRLASGSMPISPGVIRTPMHAPDTHEQLGGLHPLGRIGEISDVVEAVRYLESAPFVTGEFLHVDGGQSAGH